MADVKTNEIRPAAPSADTPAEKLFTDSTTRVARDRAEAAEYLDHLFENTRKALTTVGVVYTPIFNLDAVKNDEFYVGLKRFEQDMADFRKLVMGKSASK
jgi:hypothetical protein